MQVNHISYFLAFLLLLAVLPLPYGYYTFLRISVFTGSLFLAYQSYQHDKVNLATILAGFAILFNPIIPVYLSKELWLPIDIISAISFYLIGSKLEKEL